MSYQPSKPNKILSTQIDKQNFIDFSYRFFLFKYAYLCKSFDKFLSNQIRTTEQAEPELLRTSPPNSP